MLSCRIQQKEIAKEKLRHHFLKRIISGFAKEIDEKGRFSGNSKTAKRCRAEGTEKGINAFMERWFLVQELKGVYLKCRIDRLGK